MKKNKTTLVLNKLGMGEGSGDLQNQLLYNYFYVLSEAKEIPTYICLYADGVKLAVNDSPILEQLIFLEQRGVNILICRTCIDFYGLTDWIGVGVIGTMEDIVGAQMNCDKIITL